MTSSLRPFRWRHFRVSTTSHHSRSAKIRGLPLTYDDLRPYEPIENVQIYPDKTCYINFLDSRVASRFSQAHATNAQPSETGTRLNSTALVKLWRGESRTFVWIARSEEDTRAMGIDDVRERFKTFGLVVDVEELEPEGATRERQFSITFARLDDAAKAAKSLPSEDITHVPFDIGSVQRDVRPFPKLDPIPKFQGKNLPGTAHNLVHLLDFEPNEANWAHFRGLVAWLEVESCRILEGNVLAVKFVEPVHSTFFLDQNAKKGLFKTSSQWPEQSPFSEHRWLASQLGIARFLKMGLPRRTDELGLEGVKQEMEESKRGPIEGTINESERGEIEAKLKEEFSKFGVVVRTSTYPGVVAYPKRRQGYIEFADTDSAVEAMRTHIDSGGRFGGEHMMFYPKPQGRNPFLNTVVGKHSLNLGWLGW